MSRGGKYDEVFARRKLKVLPPEDPGFQARVDAVKESIVDRSAPEMAERYILLRCGTGPALSETETDGLIARLGKDGIKALASRCEILVKAHEQLLADSQEAGAYGWGDYGVKDNALLLPSGDVIRIQREPYGKVVDKEVFRLWCLENGFERQLQMWPTTMNAIVKERLLHGEPEPDGTEAYSYVKVVYAKKGTDE